MRPLTAHDYRELPEAGPRYQLIQGEMHLTPAPNRYHQHISRNICQILLAYMETNPVGEVYDAPFDVVLTDINVFQPDILFVSNAHRSVLTDAGAEGAPDLVVEILSPRTAQQDKGVKREIYARTGVEELWMVDPEVRRIQVFRLQEDADVPIGTHGDATSFGTPLFPGLTIDTARVFRMEG